MPADGNFDGVYQSDFGRLELTVQGETVVGLYENDNYNGRIQGEVNDNLLEFTWTQWNLEMRGKVRETNGKGVFQYVIDEIPVGATTKQYHRIEGWWGYPDGDLVNRWNGSKLSNRAKKRLEPFVPEAGEMDEGSSYDSSAGFEDAEAPTGGDEPSEQEDEEEEDEGSIDDIF
jgi:hypothetical protein